MSAPVPTISVANFFIGKSIAEGRSITPMKLVKLVYIAHGWYLGNTGNALIPEAVEAWKYGPVIPSVYRTFKKYGGNAIEGQESVWTDSGYRVPVVGDETILDFLDRVWEVYKKRTGGQLSDLTHRENTPWDITWRKDRGSEMMGAQIPNELIAQHYRELLSERSRKQAGG